MVQDCCFIEGMTPLVDPDNEEAAWVTVVIPPEMEYTHTDEEIVRYVYNQIRMKRAGVGQYALHNHGKVCISFPITINTDDIHELLARAEADAYRWLDLVLDGTVTLVRDIVFR
ncbi:hypothetical protein N7475_004651 [Penicillium sp. IBT 31633x]|nr:hypothetical protein N7475_004651 [Penicillium sp. IBT 31633x]